MQKRVWCTGSWWLRSIGCKLRCAWTWWSWELERQKENRFFIQWRGAIYARWKVKFVRACCGRLDIRYFGAMTESTNRHHLLDSCKSVLQNSNNFQKLSTCCIYDACGATQLQGAVQSVIHEKCATLVAFLSVETKTLRYGIYRYLKGSENQYMSIDIRLTWRWGTDPDDVCCRGEQEKSACFPAIYAHVSSWSRIQLYSATCY